MLQRQGFPNVSIKLYQDYNAWLENRFIELASTFVTMTLRDGLVSGVNEGLIQIYETKSLHTNMTGDEIFQISLATANTEVVYNRIYAVKHYSLSVDEKGDNVIIFSIGPMHTIQNFKFSRAFSNNAYDAINDMITYLYKDAPKCAPNIDEFNIRVPKTNWVLGVNEYFDFVRKHGMSVINEDIPLVWEDMTGLHISDFSTMVAAEPIEYVVTEPTLLGELNNAVSYKVCFDFEYQTKSNAYTRNPFRDVTYTAYSFFDKGIIQTTVGEGHNAVFISRSGAYLDQVYRDGLEEMKRRNTISQYDGYAKVKTYGDFSITPGMKLNFYDIKDQYKTDFYVDEVIHEISREQSITNIFMFTNTNPVQTEMTTEEI